MTLINLIPGCKFRVDEEGEIIGVDEVELGEWAYDFVGSSFFPPPSYHTILTFLPPAAIRREVDSAAGLIPGPNAPSSRPHLAQSASGHVKSASLHSRQRDIAADSQTHGGEFVLEDHSHHVGVGGGGGGGGMSTEEPTNAREIAPGSEARNGGVVEEIKEKVEGR